MMVDQLYRLKEELRNAIVDKLMTCLKNECGVCLTQDEYDRLGTKLHDELIGSIRI